MNDKNLIPNNRRSPNELRQQCSNGGIRSGEVRRAKKAMRETLIELLRLPIENRDIDEITSIAQAEGKNLTAEQAMCVAMIKEALKGNVKAATFVRDTSGNKLSEDVNLTVENTGPDLSSFSREELLKMADIDNGTGNE